MVCYNCNVGGIASTKNCADCGNDFCAKCRNRNNICSVCMGKREKKETVVVAVTEPEYKVSGGEKKAEKGFLVAPETTFSLLHQPMCQDLLLDSSIPARQTREEFLAYCVTNVPPKKTTHSDSEYQNIFQESLGILSRVRSTLEHLRSATSASPSGDDLTKASSILRIPIKYLDLLMAASRADTADFHSNLFEAIFFLQFEISQLPTGESFLVPVFWRGKQPKQVSADDEAHMAFLVLYKVSRDYFQLAVVNMSEGVKKYHEGFIDGASEDASEPMHRMPYAPPHLVSSPILTSSWLWYFVGLPFFNKSYGSKGVNYLYEYLVPAMTRAHPCHRFSGNHTWWQRLPIGGDRSYVLTTVAALRWSTAMSCGDERGKGLEVAVRLSVLQTAVSKLSTSSELYTARLAGRQVAKKLNECAERDASRKKQLLAILDTIEEAKINMKPVTAAAQAASVLPPPSCGTNSLLLEKGSCVHHDFDTLNRNQYDLEDAAGKNEKPRILLPINTVRIKETVGSPEDCVHVLKETLTAVNLYSSQHKQIPNQVHLSLALLQHVFLRVIPFPNNVESSGDNTQAFCSFWRPDVLTYSTQQMLLRQLDLLAKCFAAVAFSLAGRELDGLRIIVSNVILVLMDYLCRAKPTDCIPDRETVFSQHYSGEMACFPGSAHQAPIAKYVPCTVDFAVKTQDIVLYSPELAAARTRVLDYWTWTSRGVPESNVLFKLDEMRVGTSEEEFVTQLSLACGRGDDNVNVPAALTGLDPWLIEVCPEVVMLRDATFLMNLMLTEIADSLPPCDPNRPYKASDVNLQWTYETGNREANGRLMSGQHDTLTATGFRGWKLNGAKCPPKAGGIAKKAKKLFGTIREVFMGKTGAKRDISHASPAMLTDNVDVKTEEDVLYVEHPPTFGNMLGKQDSEQLLSYLTAPNIRILLLLTWFGCHERLQCLSSKALQNVLDAALFEPGTWAPPTERELPKVIPAETRDHLRTPSGLLFDELCKSPEIPLRACLQLLTIAQEKCTARFSSTSTDVILYVIRLVCRVVRYLRYLVAALKAEETEDVSRMVRGLQKAYLSSPTHCQKLEEGLKALVEELEDRCYIRLQQWVRQAEKQRTVEAACKLHAHIALIFQGNTDESFRERPWVAQAIVAAKLYITTYHMWGASDIGIAEVELCDVFETMRRPLHRAMDDETTRKKALTSGKWAATSTRPENESDVDWSQLPSWKEVHSMQGVYHDFAQEEEGSDREMKALADVKAKALEGENYAAWLRRITSTSDNLFINLNNGTCSQNKDDVGKIPDEIQQDTDFENMFGKGRMRCAALGKSEFRTKVRLLGTDEGEYNIHLWQQDSSRKPHEQALRKALGCVSLSLSWEKGCPVWAKTRINSEIQTGGLMELMSMSLRYLSHTENSCSLGGVKKVDDKEYAINVVVKQNPPVTHVFQVVSCGRRYYKSQIFTTDSVMSYHAPHKSTSSCRQGYYRYDKEWTLCAGSLEDVFQTDTSLQIFDVSGRMRMMYLPRRLLQGLIPDALLDQYRMYQSADDNDSSDDCSNITGEPLSKTDGTRIQVNLSKCPFAEVFRTHVTMDGAEVTWSLMNLMDATSTAVDLVQQFTRLENLSHILVWCTTEEDGEEVAKVELPRLRLSFTARSERLYCDQHAGYYLNTSSVDSSTATLLEQFGGGTVLLEKENGELAVVASKIAEPLRPSTAALPVDKALSWVDRRMPIQVVFRRAEPELVEKLSSGARHHFYPVHHSHTFLKTPTTSSTLYLMLCLTLRRNYTLVAEMASRLGEVTYEEDTMQLRRVVTTLTEDMDTPDAVACRLKLTISIAEVCNPQVFAELDWDLLEELEKYVMKRQGVTCELLLTVDEELHFLNVPEKSERLCNREKALKAMKVKQSSVEVTMTVPHAPSQDDHYDCKGPTEVKSTLVSFSSLAYTEDMESRVGKESLVSLDNAVRSPTGISALYVYEIFTGTKSPGVVESDHSNPIVLGSLLTRLMFYNSGVINLNINLSWLMSLEKILCAKPDFAGKLPKLPQKKEEKENEAHKKEGGPASWLPNFGLASQAAPERASVMKHAIEMHNDEIRNNNNNKKEPNLSHSTKKLRLQDFADLQDVVDTAFHTFRNAKTMEGMDKVITWKVLPKITDTSAARHVLRDCPDIQKPLRLLDEHVGEKQESLNHEVDTFQKHAREVVGAERIVKSIDERKGQERSEPFLRTISNAALNEIEETLKELKTKDEAEIKNLEARIIEKVNPREELIARIAGTKPHLGMSKIARLYLSEEDHIDQEVKKEAAQWLYHQSRVGHVRSCLISLDALRDAVRKGGNGHLMGANLARQVKAARHHVKEEYDGRLLSVNPRYMVFEFMSNILLRESQVKLMETIQESRPMVYQMIMGQGKTTVLTPLLTLLKGDCVNGKSRLVVVCIPKALVEFSKSVLLDSFSSPVMPKAVLSFDFQRTSVITQNLVDKLDRAVDAKSVMVIHPAALKSLLLKYVLLFERLDFDARVHADHAAHKETFSMTRKVHTYFASTIQGTKEVGMAARQCSDIETELRCGAKVLEVLQMRSEMLLDEVDMVLHPLRSELNWPMGDKHPIDLTVSRSEADRKYEGMRYKMPWYLFGLVFAYKNNDRHELSELPSAQQIYMKLKKALKDGMEAGKLQSTPHLAILDRRYYDSALLPHIIASLSQWVKNYVTGVTLEEIIQYIRDGVGELKPTGGDSDSKMLNLAHEWARTFLPHCLSKVHRVGFGILRSEELEKALEEEPCMSRSRQLLAVPFVGKDTPSQNSEFQHPEIAIGLTIHSMLQEGLRDRDLLAVLNTLKARYEEDERKPAQTREAAMTYVSWLKQECVCVKGYSWDGEYLAGKRNNTQPRKIEGETAEENLQRSEMWQLAVVELNDAYQMKVLMKYLQNSWEAMRFFLFECAFSEVLTKTIKQLSASGQELASDLMSSRRVGFSGTPNDLLPDGMGECVYAEGDDGEMVNTLASSLVVTVTKVTRDPKELLKKVATDPSCSALIDTGALITGLSNREVAFSLFDFGLTKRGVVYLDCDDRRMVLLKSSGGRYRDLPLKQSGLPLADRFTFYDHIHTTGMDIPQSPSSKACLTISQNMVFRDYAQGAYRMRGIGKGQTLEVFLPEDVSQLIPAVFDSGCDRMDLLMWLLKNGIASEKAQRSLLAKQLLAHLWKEKAFRKLGMEAAVEERKPAVRLLQESVTVDLSNQLKRPGSEQERLKTELKRIRGCNDALIMLGDAEGVRADEIVASAGICEESTATGVDRTQVSEAEAEQTQQQQTVRHAENEMDEDAENEEETEAVPEMADQLQYIRSGPPIHRWRIETLKEASGDQFHPLCKFPLERETLSFPPFLLSSKNFILKQSFFTTEPKRLKNVSTYLEWIPVPDTLNTMDDLSMGADRQTELKNTFKLYTTNRKDAITKNALESLLLKMELKVAAEAIMELEDMVTFSEFAKLVSSMKNLRLMKNRYMVALSLEEAEHIRALMLTDAMRDIPIALHVLHVRACLETSIVQTTKAYDAFKKQKMQGIDENHERAAEACFKFFDCQGNQKTPDMLWVLRLLKDDPITRRRTFYVSNKSMRRRPKVPWAQQPVAMVLTEEAEYSMLQVNSVISKFKMAMLVNGDLEDPNALFDALDQKGNGTLTQDDVMAGVRWLGLSRGHNDAWAKSVSKVFQQLTKSNKQDSVLTRELVKKHFAITPEEKRELLEMVGKGCTMYKTGAAPKPVSGAQKEQTTTVEPMKNIPDLISSNRRFRIDAVFASYNEKWNSTGTACDACTSVWSANLDTGSLTAKNARLLRFGDYVRPSLNEPTRTDKCVNLASQNLQKMVSLPCKVWQITDDSSYWFAKNKEIDAWIAPRFPHPTGYSLCWQLQTANPLFLWEPLPPNEDFVAGGVVATTTPTPPPLDYVRCVPKNWCRGSAEDPSTARLVIWKELSRSASPVQISADPALGLCWKADIRDTISVKTVLQGMRPMPGKCGLVHSAHSNFPDGRRMFSDTTVAMPPAEGKQ